MKRWINTLVLYDGSGRVVRREGYWYDGLIAEAVTMAAFDQAEYGFYDQGTESGSSLIGALDTPQTLEVDTNYQLRITVQNTAAGSGGTGGVTWQYNHNGGGFTAISTTSSVIQQVDDADLTDGDDTTQRQNGTGTFMTPNSWVVEAGTMPNLGFDASANSEGLLSFQIIGADVADEDTITFELTAMDSIGITPSLTVNKAAGAPRRIFVVS